jgi:hypothetical protein
VSLVHCSWGGAHERMLANRQQVLKRSRAVIHG